MIIFNIWSYPIFLTRYRVKGCVPANPKCTKLHFYRCSISLILTEIKDNNSFWIIDISHNFSFSHIFIHFQSLIKPYLVYLFSKNLKKRDIIYTIKYSISNAFTQLFWRYPSYWKWNTFLFYKNMSLMHILGLDDSVKVRRAPPG